MGQAETRPCEQGDPGPLPGWLEEPGKEEGTGSLCWKAGIVRQESGTQSDPMEGNEVKPKAFLAQRTASRVPSPPPPSRAEQRRLQRPEDKHQSD